MVHVGGQRIAVWGPSAHDFLLNARANCAEGGSSDTRDAALPLEKEAVRIFGLEHPDEDVHYCHGIAISSDARAYIPGQPLRDLWSDRRVGTRRRRILGTASGSQTLQ